jgi:hypothetical protein
LSGNQNWRCGDVWEETDRDKGLLWTLKAGVRNSRVDGLYFYLHFFMETVGSGPGAAGMEVNAPGSV